MKDGEVIQIQKLTEQYSHIEIWYIKQSLKDCFFYLYILYTVHKRIGKYWKL
jgi:hypothetical protein